MTDRRERRAAWAAGLAGATLLLAAGLSLLGAFRHVAAERERALQAWQVRLGLVAESRAASIADWLDRQRAAVQEISGNLSVQLYLTELALDSTDRAAAQGQADYLRNLLNATAERSGFAPPASGVPQVSNLPRLAASGLALIDAKRQVVAATAGMPTEDERLRAAVEQALAGRPALIDLHPVPDGIRMGFALPVAPVQGDASSPPIGAAVGLRLAGNALTGRLRQPGDTDMVSSTHMVRISGANLEYLPALDRTLSRETPGLVDAMLAELRSGFAMGRDRDGVEVLATARPVAGAPWTLVRSAPREAALAETEERLTWTLAVLVGAILAIGAAILAVWRHGTSVRLARAVEAERSAAARAERVSRFLRVVADAQPTAIVVLDGEGRCRFANRAAAEQAGASAEDLLDKTLEAVLGAARAAPLVALNRQALDRQTRVGAVHETQTADGQRQVLQSDHIPMRGGESNRPRMLMVVQDITALVVERERRGRTMQQLVATLVALVDRRDPYAAGHSARVAQVARAIAEEMGLDAVTVETADTAATLMNVGKMLVPPEILTKQGPLDPAELEQVRAAMRAGAELVRGIEFDGPVAGTLGQLLERWDGNGSPDGLKGEAILMTARIVAVANAFVALASPRAHRAGLDLDGAAAAVLARAGTQFDRRPVTALINILDNRGGRERWGWSAAPSA